MGKINQIIRYCLNYLGLEINKTARTPHGLYAKYTNFTMLPEIIFNDNLQICMEFKHLEGSIVECGVWRGGMIAAISEIMGSERDYFLFDSFEGLPPAQPIDGVNALSWQKNVTDPKFYDNCKADINFAKNAMKISKAKRYRIEKGWFTETLPNFGTDKIAILRLDADWYDSTLECLNYLYPKVVKGGCIIIDDYYTWDGCSKALHDYLSKHKLPDRIFQKNNRVCFLIKN